MLVSNAYNRYRNIKDSYRADRTDPVDLRGLADILGIHEDDLEIRGAKSLKEITVYTCVKIRAEALGKLPIKIYQNLKDGKRRAADHYLSPLLLRPNPYMSWMDYQTCLEVQRGIFGNAYSWMDVLPSGHIAGFYPLYSPNMQIWCDDRGLLNSSNKVWYIYTDRAGGKHRIAADEIEHFKDISLDGIVGMSPVEMLRRTIENSKSATLFLNNSYKGGMSTKGIVHYVGDLDQAAEDKFRSDWERMSSGLKNVNKISLLPIGYKYEPIAMNLADAQFLENTKLSIQQLTAAYGIKPHQVNDTTKTSYASVAESNREFYTDTMLGILTIYEQEMNYKEFTNLEIKQGFYKKYNADVILRGDIKARYDAYAVAVQNMIKTPNECRALEEDEPLSGGDILYGNGTLCPATLLEKGVNYNKGGQK